MRRFFWLSLLSLFVLPLFGETVQEFFFEITRYSLTGFSSSPYAPPLAHISKTAAALSAQRVIPKTGDAFDSFSLMHPVYLCEHFLPQKIGVIDSTFCDEDLYAVVADSSSAEDSGASFDWVDMVLLNLNAPTENNPKTAESFGILDGEKILEMLENNDGRGIDAQAEEEKRDETPLEFVYVKNDGELRRFSYDGEQFSLSKDGENMVLVNSYGDKLIRKTFDSLYRLVKNERFKTTASAKKMTQESLLSYSYVGESTIPETALDENMLQKKRTEQHFDAKGRVVRSLEGHYEEQEVKKSKKKKDEEPETELVLKNDRQRALSYTAGGKIADEEITTWAYKKNLAGKESVEERVVKNVYTYHENASLPADLAFYENGELHLERKYTTASDYSEKLYFDGGFSVELVYEGGLKKTEIIYLNDVEQRRRTFDY